MSDNIESRPLARRWYDQDPLLAETLELLRAYPAEAREQSRQFLERIEAEIGPDMLNRFFDLVQNSPPEGKQQRWYDQDPLVSRAVALLRLIPPATQRQTVERFLEALRKQGISSESLPSDRL